MLIDSCTLSTGSPLLKSIVRYSVPLKDASDGALSETKKPTGQEIGQFAETVFVMKPLSALYNIITDSEIGNILRS